MTHFSRICCAWVWLGTVYAVAAERPNIVFIYADDLGYAGLSATGATDIQTPNIDSLAANGVRF